MKTGEIGYDTIKEEGYIKINWAVMPDDVVLLDTLQDWIVELQDLYAKKHKELFIKKGSV